MAKKKVDRIANIEDTVKGLASIVGQMVELQTATPKATTKTAGTSAKSDSEFTDKISVYSDSDTIKIGKNNPYVKGEFVNKHIQVSFRVVNGKPVQMGLSVLG